MADRLENVQQQHQEWQLGSSTSPLPPPEGFLQKFRLYKTQSKFYMVGRDKIRTYWKLLKIDRSESSELNIREDSTTYTEQECSDLLRRIHEGNSDTGGLNFVTTCYGIIGFIKFLGPHYMLLITKRRQIGSICGHNVYAISKSEIIPLSNSAVRSSKVNCNNENRYKKLLCMVDLTKDFYFSYSYHVMRSLQKNMRDKETGKVLYETMFVWNEFLTRGIRNILQNTIWTVALVYGFFKQDTISISGRNLKLTLIARRSRHYAGTRYLKRGVNEKGRVANDVETEQIVTEEVPEGMQMQVSSVVQNRGSIPLFWSQETSRLNIKPDTILSKQDATYKATRLHVENLVKRYGNPIIILNLIKTNEKKPRESILRTEFDNAIKVINKDLSEENQLKFVHLDLHKHSRSKATNVLVLLGKVSSYALSLTGFFYCQVTPALLSDWHLKWPTFEKPYEIGGLHIVKSVQFFRLLVFCAHERLYTIMKRGKKHPTPQRVPPFATCCLNEKIEKLTPPTFAYVRVATWSTFCLFCFARDNPKGIFVSQGAILKMFSGERGRHCGPFRRAWQQISRFLHLVRKNFAAPDLSNQAYSSADNDQHNDDEDEGSDCLGRKFVSNDSGNNSPVNSPMFQMGVLRTNCIDCLDRTNVAQYAYGLVAFGHQLHALGVTTSTKVDLDDPLAEELMGFYERMGDTLAHQYGGSAAHNKIFSERRGQWNAATQSQEFFRTLQRYYSNAYIDAEKQNAINIFLGRFQPQSGKPDVWKLHSDQHYNDGRIGQSNIYENGRSLFKRSWSDWNIFGESRSPTSISNIHKSVPEAEFSMGSKGVSKILSESTPDILTPESELSYSSCTPSMQTREFYAQTQRERSLQHDNGDGIDCSNFVDLDWLSSSGNSCEEELLERLMLSASSTAVQSSENFINDTVEETTPSTSVYGSSARVREHTRTDLYSGEDLNYGVLEEFSDSFVRWVVYGEALCQ